MMTVFFLGFCVAGVRAELQGGLATGVVVTWGDDLVEDGTIPPAEQPDLLDGDPDTLVVWNWWTYPTSELSASFDVKVNLTGAVFTFRIYNTNGFVPTVSLYRDAAHTDLVATVAGNLNPSNGTFSSTFLRLDEELFLKSVFDFNRSEL